MKVISFLLAFSVLLTACNNSNQTAAENNNVSGDMIPPVATFEGVFTGTTPCADCPGIYMVSAFLANGSYFQSMNYMERNTQVTDSGKWDIQDSLITVTFQGANSQPRYFKVMNDSAVRLLDGDQKIIPGALEKYYILQKKDTIISR